MYFYLQRSDPMVSEHDPVRDEHRGQDCDLRPPSLGLRGLQTVPGQVGDRRWQAEIRYDPQERLDGRLEQQHLRFVGNHLLRHPRFVLKKSAENSVFKNILWNLFVIPLRLLSFHFNFVINFCVTIQSYCKLIKLWLLVNYRWCCVFSFVSYDTIRKKFGSSHSSELGRICRKRSCELYCTCLKRFTWPVISSWDISNNIFEP